MRHRIAGRKLNRPTQHRLLMLRNQVTQFLKHERIITTEAKARETRRLAERVITFGKQGTLHHRRMALAFVLDKSVTRKVFNELAARYEERQGGYTRLVKVEPRKGDGAPMAILELV